VIRLLLAGAAAAVLVVFHLGYDTASAKVTTYLLTGGDLGTHAYLLTGFIPDDDGTDWVASVDGVEVEAPDSVPSLAFDLYRRYGTFALIEDEPELRYYPDIQLMYSVWGDRWYQLPVEAVSYLNAAIDDGLAAMKRGELEENALVADLRDRGMHEVGYSLLPYVPRGSTAVSDATRALNEECSPLCGSILDQEAFVLVHLVETIAQPAALIPGAEPAYEIIFEGWSGDTGIGGVLGYYSPPSEGSPGLFWMEDSESQPYETTDGFDVAIVAALNGANPSDALNTISNKRDANDGSTAVAAAALATVLGFGLVVGVVRRRGG